MEKKAVMGIAGGEDKISVLVGKAIELAGGLGFIKKGSTVLIKPNINTGDPHPASTNPEIVYEIINLVKKQNPYRILVGDRSGYWLDTIAVSYTHLRAHETVLDLVCRLLLEKK